MTMEIAQLLPHTPPMVLVDGLISNADRSVVVEATIRSDYPFTSGPIGSWVGLELMAQSAAALAKLAKQSGSDKPALGFLLGSRNFIAHIPEFAPGQKVTIEIDLDPVIEGQAVVNANGKIKDASGQIICEGSLTLFEPNNDALYLSA